MAKMSDCPLVRDPTELCYSEDIQSYLPNMPRSRPLYRFSNRGSTEQQQQPASSQQCSGDDNLRMESMLLRQNKNVPIGRCSTPVPEYCSHCDHRHGERCCQYVGDAEEDIRLYSMWTQQLRNPAVKPQDISRMPEVVSSGGTPEWFPQFSYNKPELIERMMHRKEVKQVHSNPTMFSTPMHQLTHYQQYLLHLQQMQLTMDTPYYGQPYGPTEMIPYQPFFQPQYYSYNVFNGPVYIQQNNQSPYFQQQVQHNYTPEFYPCQQQVPPRVPLPIGSHLRQQRPQPWSQEFDKQYYAPYFANPAPSNDPTSSCYPLWMLFWNNNNNRARAGEENRDFVQIAGCEVPLKMEVDEQMRDFPVAV